jgi:hypothetical protein
MIFFTGGFHVRKLRPARAAPGRSRIEHHDFAFVVSGEIDQFAIHGLRMKSGNLLAGAESATRFRRGSRLFLRNGDNDACTCNGSNEQEERERLGFVNTRNLIIARRSSIKNRLFRQAFMAV